VKDQCGEERPTFQERLVVGSDGATIVGGGLDASVDKVQFQGKDLTNAGATAVARTQKISLIPKTGATTKVTLEIVSQKIETVAK
jgi:hypothetical protein